MRLFFFSPFDVGSDGSDVVVCSNCMVDVTCEASNFTVATSDESGEFSGDADIGGAGGDAIDVFVLIFRFPDIFQTDTIKLCRYHFRFL